jgi:hypothetical protein
MTMVATQPWYFSKRAEHLAVMYLTRRPEFIVEHQMHDLGYDLVVAMAEGQITSGRIFAVQVKATDLRDVLIARDSTLREKWSDGTRAVLENVPFPVCVFVFVMREHDDAYYAWLKAPIVQNGRATLAVDFEPKLEKLDDDALARISDEVACWYDARRSDPGTSTPSP